MPSRLRQHVWWVDIDKLFVTKRVHTEGKIIYPSKNHRRTVKYIRNWFHEIGNWDKKTFTGRATDLEIVISHDNSLAWDDTKWTRFTSDGFSFRRCRIQQKQLHQIPMLQRMQLQQFAMDYHWDSSAVWGFQMRTKGRHSFLDSSILRPPKRSRWNHAWKLWEGKSCFWAEVPRCRTVWLLPSHCTCFWLNARQMTLWSEP